LSITVTPASWPRASESIVESSRPPNPAPRIRTREFTPSQDIGRPRPAAPGHRPRFSGHPAGVIEGASQQHLDLSVEAAELVSRPPGQGVVDRWVDTQQNLLALGTHE
jgi:hypothetical protein